MEGKGVSLRASMVLLVVLMWVGLWGAREASGLTAGECKAERNILVTACKAVVSKKPPSAFCCQRLRVTHIQCVCPIITPQLAALIDVNYAVKVVQSCGRQVPRHYKCGSITTP